MKHQISIVALAPLEAQGECKIPFAQSLISAGFPSSAENFIESSLDLNDLLIKHKSATFFIRVLGNSMVNAGIQSNDILIVDRSLMPAHNKIAVVRINDEFTVKRLKISGSTIYLMPENDEYQPIKITEDMDFQVWGIVTSVIHQM